MKRDLAGQSACGGGTCHSSSGAGSACRQACSRAGSVSIPSAAGAASAGTMGRRDFLSSCAGWTVGVAALGYAGATLEYLEPRVLYEPPTEFSVGKLVDFPPDSATFLEDKRLFVFRSSEGLYAVSAVCTHLGCNVRWSGSKEDFECPCHGSLYDRHGRVVSGPAPKPLEWYALTCNKTGAVIVDTLKTVAPDFRLRV